MNTADRELMQQALDAFDSMIGRKPERVDQVIAALRERLAHCDRCGKRMGGEGDIHTCSPDPIGDAQAKLIAELAAQPTMFGPMGTAKDRQVGGDHYKEMGVQPWDVVDTWPRDQRIGYYRGGALKYLMRMGSKDESPIEVAKGQHYIQKLLEVLQEQN
jgi:hypothetical protein